ncbi:hypothetical protein N7524_008519 [Penicillium chrysogenum]|nr:hypothetical protein N7524_008519 [Penicillium chrysogenum]
MANEDTTQQGMMIDNFNARQGQSVEVHRIRDIERVCFYVAAATAHETGVRNGPTIQDLEKGDYNQIWEWNKTVPAAISNLVHKLIHDNVEVNPGAPAVCSWDGNLTYAELNDLSSRLADEPKSRGVGPEVIQLYSPTGKRVNPIVELVTTGASKGSGGRPTLVCFLAMSQIESAEPEDAQQLRQAMWDLTKDLNKSLVKTLPQYMVPSVYIPLWQFPLHSSGKTDRRQLQVTGLVLPRQDLAALRAPPTKAKATTTALQSRTPPDTFVDEIAREDHFFRLGRDSLSAIQLATLAAHEKLALTVQDTVQDIFDNPALARTTAV